MASILNILAMHRSEQLQDELAADREKQAEEAKAKRIEELRKQEHELQRKCVKIEGWQKFNAWYFSEAVPDPMSTAGRIELVREHLKGLVEKAGERLGQKWQAYFDADDAGADQAQLMKLEKAAAAAGKRYEKAHKAGSR